MNRILINLPEVVETSRLKLQMPKAGFGQEVYDAINDGYEDYVKWLNWPSIPPTLESVEEGYWTDFSRQIFTNFASLFIRRF